MAIKSTSALVAVALALIPARSTFSQCGYDWMPGQGIAHPDCPVDALAVWDDGSGAALYVGGHLRIAGNSIVRHIARWDGVNFQPLGLGVNGSVSALAVYDGDLIVAGGFTKAGGISANRIARWDGTSWSALGGGLTGGDANVLHVHNGELIVSGYFTQAGGQPATYMARWNGTNWSPMPPLPLSQWALALTTYAGQLVAAGGNPSRVLVWNGTSWEVLGSPEPGGRVDSVSLFNGDLVAGGSFNSIGGVAADEVARWDGVSWAGFGPLPGTPGSVNKLVSFDGSLIALRSSGNCNCTLHRWNGMSWDYIGDVGGSGAVYALASFGGELFAGGEFFVNGTLYIARWNGSAWQSLGEDSYPSTSGGLGDLALHNGVVHGVGYHYTAPGASSYRVVRRIGAAWEPLPGVFNCCDGVVVLYSSALGLFAGGAFSTIDGATMNGMARWDGSAWSSLAGGMCCSPRTVFALTEFGGELIAGGNFTSAGATPAKRVARWNGASWSTLGSGFEEGQVEALVVHNGSLIAGGTFRSSGTTVVNRVASWDGNAWNPLGNGMNSGAVKALRVYSDDLYAAGTFQSGSGMPTLNIARWNGSIWLPVGGGINGTVEDLVLYEGELVAVGSFSMAGDSPANKIARWNGNRWAGFGAGVGIDSYSSAFDAIGYQDELFVGGSFDTAGWQVSYYFARWASAGPAVVTQPLSQGVCLGGSVSLSVNAPGAVSHQWRRADAPLVNIGNISGATTNTLAINPVDSSTAASDYNCLLSGPGCPGSGSTQPAAIWVLDDTGDGNVDGRTNANDIQGLLDAILTGNPTPTSLCAYDLSGDGQVTLNDVAPFVTALLGP